MLPSIRDFLKSLSGRGVVLPDEYKEQRQEGAKNYAFTIAGITQLDQLQAILDSLDRNIQNGGDFAAWKDAIASGDISLEVPDWRKELIFRNHAQNTFMLGRCTKARNSDRLTYGYYSAIRDPRARPAHAKWHGTCLPLEHPWWRSHMPSNGHNCRCSIINLTETQAKRKGITQEDQINWDDPDEGWEHSPCEQITKGTEQAVKKKVYAKKLGGKVAGLLKALQAVRMVYAGDKT